MKEAAVSGLTDWGGSGKVAALFGSEGMGNNMESAGGEASGRPIFISYRRVDRAAFADPFFERLTDWFGPDAVFLDRKDIELGAKFPEELDRAVRAAKVVLVLITPQWVPEFDKRSKDPATGIDYVRQEVALALDLPGCVVIPVYWDCQPGPKTALPEDVRDIIDRNSVLEDGPLRLEGPADSWGASYLALRAHIEAKAGIKPVSARSDQAFWNMTQNKLIDLLAIESMAPLKKEWGSDRLGSIDVTSVEMGGLAQHLADFVNAVENATSVWRRDPGSDTVRTDRRQQCQRILSALCGLFVDRRSARHWTKPQEASGPVPAFYAGTASLVYAVANGLPVTVRLDHKDSVGFLPERTAMMDEADSGCGTNRRGQAHKAVWKAAKTDDYPRGNQPLEGEALKKLRGDMIASAMVKKPYVLTGVVGESLAYKELVGFGEELSIAAVGRIGLSDTPGSSVLHCDEHVLNSLIVLGLKAIRELP
jgi:TIR domain